MSVPHAVRLGSPAILTCNFLLDGDALYSVKWYKGGREFYRYTPKETPALKVFPMPGLTEHDVKKEESNATQVSLREVSGSMAGSYSCEVSADAPSFHTVVVTAHLDVVEAPSGQPSIHGLKPRYRPGNVINASCSTPGSKPAANLTWFVNGEHVGGEAVRQYREMDSELMEVSISTIKLLATPSLFPSGRLKLKCTASIYSLYWQTTEKSSEMERGRGHSNDIFDNDLNNEDHEYLPSSGEEYNDKGTESSHIGSAAHVIRLDLNYIINFSANLLLSILIMQL
ncbi:cell adhesion molecule 2 [Halyomorpha halys]|uniref:cell adhesion molecule 2 n=1 Tax=Halyomorpha halys TaxID=286706 RepID=UPI0006D50BAA